MDDAAPPMWHKPMGAMSEAESGLIRTMVSPSVIPATIVLEDGVRFHGFSFGYDGSSTSGEVVFNTGMVGYPESLTDPSYRGQILTLTYPLIGNYGVPAANENDENGIPVHFESDRIHVRAIIVSNYSQTHSHHISKRSLSDWLISEKVVGVTGVDTRALTKHLRVHGSMLGKVLLGDAKPEALEFYNPNNTNLVSEVSCKDAFYLPQKVQDHD
eukprot:Selendium_serpulae@DN9336_c0_g1_i1.p1